MKKYILIVVALVFSLHANAKVFNLHANTKGWLTNIEEAQELAKKNGKGLLINFTGGAENEACAKFEKEVLNNNYFKRKIMPSYVLVRLEFSADPSISTDQMFYNEDQRNKYDVQAVPTVLLLDNNGNQILKTNDTITPVKKYVDQILILQKEHIVRQRKLKKCEMLKGNMKAKELDSALSNLSSEDALNIYPEQVDLIIKLDAKNQLGLKNKYLYKTACLVIKEQLQNDPQAARKTIDKTLKELKPTGTRKQNLLVMKAQIYWKKKDRKNTKKIFKEALSASPNSSQAADISKILAMYFSPFADRLIEISKYSKDIANHKKLAKALKMIDKTEKEMKLSNLEKQQLYALKGDLLMKSGDKDAAGKAFVKALQEVPDSKAAVQITWMLDSLAEDVKEEDKRVQGKVETFDEKNTPAEITWGKKGK